MSNLSLNNNVPIDYNQLANFNNNGLSLYGGSNFDLLLSSGALGQGLGNLPQTSGNNLPPTTAALLNAGAQQLSSSLLGRVDPLPQNYSATSPYSSSLLPPGLGSMDLLGAIAANTLPLIKTGGFLGTLLQTVPQTFQLVTGSIAALNAWKMFRAQPQEPNRISQNAQDEIVYEAELTEDFYT